MKVYKLIVSAIVLLSVIACEDVMKQKVEFDVKVAPADYLQLTDSGYVAPVGSKITFDFIGEPDFISFKYDRFLPTNSSLMFATQAAWGTHIENTLQVYLSDSFGNLSYKLVNNNTDSINVPVFNFIKDSTAIASHTWRNISSLCNLPITANLKKDASVSINEYRGKKIVIALRYKTDFKADWQPSWTVTDLLIKNTRITDNSEVTTYLAATMGFMPFDMLNRTNPYRNEEGVSGVWSFPAKADKIVMRQTSSNKDLNEDWVVSKPVEVPLGLVEQGKAVSVKNMTMDVNQYSYKFDKVGEYTITFKASNYNYQHQASAEKTIKIVISD